MVALSSYLSPGEAARVNWIDTEIAAGEAEFIEQLETAGTVITLEEWAERDKKIAQTELASKDVADRLTRCGVEGGGYHDGEPLQIVSAHTGQVKQLESWRRCNWIPATAQAKRNQLLNALIYFVEIMVRKPGIAFRHICIHDGPRCHASDLVERWRVQGKRVNSWNKSEWAERLGAMFVFRSHEAGSPVKKSHQKTTDRRTGKRTRPYILDENGNRINCLDADGKQTWHPHTHAILMLERRLSDAEFAELIRRLKHHFDCAVPDHGILKEPREACKYLVKCDELMNCDDAAFVDFCLETKGARLVSCLGPFSRFRKKLKNSGRKIIAQKNSETGKAEYRAVKNWNSNPASRVADRTPGEELEANIRRDILGNAGALTSPALISRMAPQPLFTPIAEPVFMVRGRNIDLEEFYGRRQIASVIAITAEDFEAGAALFRMQFGMSVDAWLSQGHAAAQAASVGVDLSTVQPDLKGSAHNTPATGISPHPSKPTKSHRGETEAASAPPVGPPQAVSSNSPPEKPPSQSLDTDFNSPGCLHACPDEAVIVDYF